MPHDCHSRARPISTANSAGWAKDVCRNVSPSSPSVPNSTSSSGCGSIPSTASAHRVTVSVNTGSASNNSRVIPGYWLPCPVNSHAVFGGSPHTPRTAPGPSRFSANPASSSRAPSTESTTSAARCSKCERPAPAVKHTSAMSTSGCASSQSPYRCANATSACGDRAGQRQHADWFSVDRRGRISCRYSRLRWRLLDQDVCVRAGEPEGTYSGAPRPAVGLPRGRLVDDPHRQASPTECVATGSRSAGSAAVLRAAATARP